MTNPINYQNQSIPAYSGITINITNPTLNAAPMNQNCPPNCPAHNQQQPQVTVQQTPVTTQNNQVTNSEQYGVSNPIGQTNAYNKANTQTASENQFSNTDTTVTQAQESKKITNTNSTTDTESITKTNNSIQEGIPQAYPPQYYLNNYNYIQNGEKENAQTAQNPNENINQTPEQVENSIPSQSNETAQSQEEDLSSSREIINELDARVAEQKELEKNGKQTRVIALTNEYIMSLENYLNNPNTEIRLMAAKEILTRLDEDKNRFDDAALNALLNKMLQDPEKLVRIAALSAFSSQLASGNDYTVQLLTKIQNNPNGDKEDALQAADSLLKMSSRTEIRYTPVNNNYTEEQ